MRVDFNVPQDENLNVTDNTRIVAVKPTVDKILADGGSVILMTHLGRPKGEVNDKYSLKHILSEVSKVLGQDVKFVEESVGEKAEQAAAQLKPGEILLLEMEGRWNVILGKSFLNIFKSYRQNFIIEEKQEI